MFIWYEAVCPFWDVLRAMMLFGTSTQSRPAFPREFTKIHLSLGCGEDSVCEVFTEFRFSLPK